MVLLSSPVSGQGGGTTTASQPSCGNGEDQVDSFTGSGSQTTDSFSITSQEWRYLYEANSSSGAGNISIEALDNSGNSVPFSPSNAAVIPDADASSIGIEGPGTFRLEIEADADVSYSIIVCQRATPGAQTTAERTVSTNQDDDEITVDNQPRRDQPRRDQPSRDIINIPNKPLPPTGGWPVYVTVTAFVLVGAGLLGLGIGISRRGPRR